MISLALIQVSEVGADNIILFLDLYAFLTAHVLSVAGLRVFTVDLDASIIAHEGDRHLQSDA